MRDVTPEEVRQAAAQANITRVDHHDCGMCGYMTAYLIDGDSIYFDAGCNCSSYGPSPFRQASWSDAADWINMQTRPDIKAALARLFGIESLNAGDRTARPTAPQVA